MKPVVWMQFADVMEGTPDLLDGLGFVVTSVDAYAIHLDVYDIAIGEDIEACKTCELFIKWDGCSHMNIGPNDVMHLCGSENWAQKMELIRCGGFTLAARLVSKFDAELASWENKRPVVELKHEYLTKEVS